MLQDNAIEIMILILCIYILMKVLIFLWQIFLRPPKDLIQRYGQNSWVIVTGGAEGIGKAFSITFGSMGFNVILIDRNQALMDKIVKIIKSKSSNPLIQTHTICVDFNTTNVDQLYSNIKQNILMKAKFEDVSVLVNSAGALRNKDFHKLSSLDLQAIVQVDIYSQLMMTNMILPSMLKRTKRSCIIDISSVEGLRPITGSVRSASNAFISVLSQSLATQYGNQIDYKVLHPNFVSKLMVNHIKDNAISISSKKCAEALIRELGYPGIKSSGHWKHKIINWYLVHMASAHSYTQYFSDFINMRHQINFKKQLIEESINIHIFNEQYAFHGPVAIKADQYASKLQRGQKFPFQEITYLNMDDPQMLVQPAITFIRQVLACVFDPKLIQKKVFHDDVSKRAQFYINQINSLGAYSESQGYKFVRQSVADYIQKRDGFPCNMDNIFLENGSGALVSTIISLLIQKPCQGIMVPIPQYPLYRAEIIKQGGQLIPCYLNEEKDWSFQKEELERAYKDAVNSGYKPKAFVAINLGNPTASVLDIQDIKTVIQFCYQKNLTLLADEVYQANVYNPNKKFHSFKKVLMSMGSPISDDLELISFHSISIGLTGECGLRGGYMELFNVDQFAKAQIMKLQSVASGSGTLGQIGVELMVNPPSLINESQETVDMYTSEINHIFNSLKSRAKIVTEALSKMKNIQVKEVQGALCAFPRINFSHNAIEAAKKEGMPPDEFYSFQVLEQTGIVIVPGSGFHQAPGSYHVRIIILLYPEEKMIQAMERFAKFNDDFHAKFA